MPEYALHPAEPQRLRASPHGGLTLAEQQGAFHTMLLARRFEEKAGQLFAMGEIGGACPLCIGREAVAVGLAMAREVGDQLVAAARGNAHMLAAGLEARAIMAELLGRGSGFSKGLGGAMHMYAPKAGFYGGHGHAGASAPIGAGLAFANRYRGTAHVTWSLIEARDIDAGQVHETLANAAAMRLPLVLVIENDSYESAAPGGGAGIAPTDLARRGRAFNIPGWQVDGTDVGAVREAGRRARAWARGGNGPFILEVLTLPYRGHAAAATGGSGSGTTAQRAPRDPITLARERLRLAGVGEEELRAIDQQVRAIVEDAATFARQDGEPDASVLHG